MKYRVGRPFWRAAARAGMELEVRVDVHFDAQSKTYWADSADLDGLVCEGRTWDELVPAVSDCVAMLLEAQLQRAPKRAPYTALHPAVPA